MFAGLTGLSLQVYNSLHPGDPLTPLCANVIYEWPPFYIFHFYFQWIPVVLAEAPKEAPQGVRQGVPQEAPQEIPQEAPQEVAQVEQVY